MPAYVNFGAVLFSMIFSVVLGFIWYGPLFGKKWMALSGIVMPSEKPKFSSMIRPIVISFVGAIFMSFVLSSSIAFHNAYYGVVGYAPTLSIAIFLWLGFIVPVHLNFSGWEKKSWTLFFINTSYWLVFLLVSASVVVCLK